MISNVFIYYYFGVAIDFQFILCKDVRCFTGVGFRIGGNTKIHYIVIQLHYAKKFARE